MCIIYLFIYLSGVGSKTTMSNEHLILMKWSRDFFWCFFSFATLAGECNEHEVLIVVENGKLDMVNQTNHNSHV